MKRTLILCLLLALLCACAAAEEAGQETLTSGDFTYVLLDDGTAEITRCNSSNSITDLAIPSEIDGHSVTGIGDSAFDECNNLRSVMIPDSIRTMNTNPFKLCSRLNMIIVSPDHPYLAMIDGVLFSKPDRRLVCYPYAFRNASYAIPQGIRIIGDKAFYSCASLTGVTIPDSVTAIGDRAFYSCARLNGVMIPDSVTEIGAYAFSGCGRLDEITIPDSVTDIGEGAFSFCSSLSSVTLPNSVTAISAWAFSDSDSLSSITIPDSVTSIGESAFYYCSSLSSVTIPDSVTSIGDAAFYFCGGLSGIAIPDSVTSIGSGAFARCSNLFAITVGRDSYAKQYCIENKLPYTYADANDWLTGD